MRKTRGSVPVIGVGGAIGSGKSSVASLFLAHQATIIDLDRLSRDLSQKGRRLWKEIIIAFGPSFLNHRGEINRKKLGRVVFKNWKALFLLNQITHPILRSKTIKLIQHHYPSKMIVIDGAVLYEAQLLSLVDCLIFVDSPEEQRFKRLSQKDCSTNDILARMKSQRFISCLRRRSDIIIENNTTPEELRKKIDCICQFTSGNQITSYQKTR